MIDLLKPNNVSSKEPGRSTPSYHKSPLSGSHHLTPVGSNIGKFIPSSIANKIGPGVTNTPPAYHNLPINQNMFYNPTVKSNELVPPSPMIQAPFVIRPGESHPGLQFPMNNLAEGLQNHPINDINNNDVSGSLNSILHQLQNQYPSQPKNLEELLQRSFSSVPSNSMYQSFQSAMPSPFVGHNTPSSHFQMSMGSEFSRGFNSNLLGTPLQNNQLFNGKQQQMQMQMNAPQSNDAVHSMLISQLADLLKQESENKIKSAIAELLLKYKALGLLTDKIIGKEVANLEDMVSYGRSVNQQQQQQQQQHQQHQQLLQQHWQVHQVAQPLTPQAQLQLQQAQHQQQQQQWRMRQLSQAQAQNKEINQIPTFSLTSGLTMHALQRNDDNKQGGNVLSDLKNNFHSNKVEAARKGLFIMEPASERKVAPLGFLDNHPKQQTSFPITSLNCQTAHVSSSIGALNQQLGEMTIQNGMSLILSLIINFLRTKS